MGVPKSEAASQEVSNPSEAASQCQEVSNPSESADGEALESPEQENISDPPSEEAKPKPVPVPAPRISFRSTDRRPLLTKQAEREETAVQKAADSGDDSSSYNPPGFLYKVHSTMRLLTCWRMKL